MFGFSPLAARAFADQGASASAVTGSATERPDLGVGTATLGSTSSIAGSVTEQRDTSSSAIAVSAALAGAQVEQPDLGTAGSASLVASLSGTAVESIDLTAGSIGTAGITSVSGSPAEQPDAMSGGAALTAAVAASVTEQADNAAATAFLAALLAGMAAEQPDAASGSASLAVALSGGITEQPDACSGTIGLLGILTLSMNVTEQPDACSGSLVLFVPFSPSTVTPPSRTLPIFDEGRFPIYGVVGRSSMFKRDVIGLFIRKDPDSTLDYRLDWAPPSDSWLGTDVITSATWKIDDGIDNDASSNTATTATIWLAGGTAGTTYNVTCRITTATGRIDDRSFRVIVQNR